MPSVLDQHTVREWDRQRDEPPACWFAFKRWRDAAPPPTYTQLAEELEVDPSTVGRWAAEWSWKARRLAYDRWVSSGDAAAAKLTSETMAAAHLTAAAQLRDVGLRALRRLQDQLEVDPRAVSASAAVRAVETGVKIERLTFGQPTEISDNPPDYSRLSDEEFELLCRLQGKAQGVEPGTTGGGSSTT